MKKTILTLTLAGATAGSAMAQGVVTFIASGSARPIQFSLTQQAAGDTKVTANGVNPAQVSTFGNLNVAFFSTTAGTVLTLDGNNLPNFSVGGWTQASLIIQTISPTAGNIAGTGVTLGTATSPVQFEVVGWTGTATTWAQAEANALAGTALIGFSGSALSGGSLSWSQTSGVSPAPAGPLVTGASGFNGLVLTTVPEPSTIALGA